MNALPRDARSRLTSLSILAVIVAACGSTQVSASHSPTASRTSRPPSAVPSAPPSSSSPSPTVAAHVERAASMIMARTGFDAVGLGDGTILAVGDDMACYPGPATAGSERAERYDPVSDAWTAVQSLNKPRKTFATVILGDGRAMVLGGINPEDVGYSSTKIFDPSRGRWSDGPLLDVARGDPAAVLMADGRVLVASPTRFEETSSTTTTEIFDPETGSWKNSTPLEGWWIHSLMNLTGGEVLAVGDGFEIEQVTFLFDPATETWHQVADPSLVGPSFLPLIDGTVLAFGLAEDVNGRMPSTRVERFDPATGRWTKAASLSTARFAAQLAPLADGRALVAGGSGSYADESAGVTFVTTEIYDPVFDRWTPGPDLLEPRKGGLATQLRDGSVLIYGGDADFNENGDVPWCPSPMRSVERLYLGS